METRTFPLGHASVSVSSITADACAGLADSSRPMIKAGVEKLKALAGVKIELKE